MVRMKHEDPRDWDNFSPIISNRKPEGPLEKIRATILYLIFSVIVSGILGSIVGILSLRHSEAAMEANAGTWSTNPAIREAFYSVAGLVGGIILVIMLVAWFASDWFAKKDVKWPSPWRLWYWWR